MYEVSKMKILVKPQRIIRASANPLRARRVYSVEEINDEAEETEFGDPDDEVVSDDVEEAFNQLVQKLRDASYEVFQRNEKMVHVLNRATKPRIKLESFHIHLK